MPDNSALRRQQRELHRQQCDRGAGVEVTEEARLVAQYAPDRGPRQRPADNDHGEEYRARQQARPVDLLDRVEIIDPQGAQTRDDQHRQSSRRLPATETRPDRRSHQPCFGDQRAFEKHADGRVANGQLVTRRQRDARHFAAAAVEQHRVGFLEYFEEHLPIRADDPELGGAEVGIGDDQVVVVSASDLDMAARELVILGTTPVPRPDAQN
jgi:hypothetical protein